ncbi:MAG: polysaccharide biosynthesis tyrosine autokinase [Saprospiraceae bacterium]|jgi:tyrosine-protein kinase Etk/Wzc|nr:polysaccharide biosynthesis tyrosine autokinase [Saprospiraceae bacterium]
MGDNQFNLRQLFYKGLGYWYFFVIALTAMLAGAYFYLQYTMPVYKSEGMILIKDDENSGQPSEEIFFSELGMGKKSKTLENETLVLTSTPLMQEVVRKLNLQYQYTSIDGLKKRALYKNSPVQVISWQPVNDQVELYGVLTDNGRGGYQFTIEETEQVYNGEFGKELKLPTGTITISHKPGEYADTQIGILILTEYGTARGLADALKVEIMGEQSSTLKLSIKDNSPERAHDIVSELMEAYNANSVAIRNKAHENTIEMVNERIDMIASNLSEAERSLEIYQQNNAQVSLGAEGTQLLAEMSSFNKEITATEVQIQILQTVEDFLVKNRNNFEFVPTNLNLNNLTLTNQLERFNQLLNDRSRMESTLGVAHPDLLLAQKEIQNLRQTIIENIRSIKNDLVIASNTNKGVRSTLESRMSSLPRREREQLEMMRQKDVKENLYLYLLQKREEAAVSLAVTAPKGRVVEPATLSYAKLSPKGSQIWMVAFFLGFAIPIGLIFFLENLNDKVQKEEDITHATSVPLGGTLGLSNSKEKLVVRENSRTAIAEMFRLLRANLAYIAPGTDLKTLLMTSSTSGEGKSFIALNLGMSLALSGKRVLIVELDLRKPKQEAYMSIEPAEDGIVNYLIDHSMKPSKILRNTGLHLNLDFIASGPVPPNPSELILSTRLRDLLAEMRERYDFIILDAPPVGLVADALQMKDIADATMYVVRMNYTRRGQLQIVDDIAKKDKLPRPFIVLNGVPVNKPGQTGAYAYGYGYGNSKNGYYEPEKRSKHKTKVKTKPVHLN